MSRRPHRAVPLTMLPLATFARLLALLSQAVPYVPAPLAEEIRAALREGA